MNDDIRYFFKNAENRMFYQKGRGRGEEKGELEWWFERWRGLKI